MTMRRLDRICDQLRVQRYVPYWNMWSTLNVMCIVHSNMWSTTSSYRYAPFTWSCDRPTKLTNMHCSFEYIIDVSAPLIRIHMRLTTSSTDMHCSFEDVVDYAIDESALFTRRRYWPLRFDALWDVSGTLVGGTLVGGTLVGGMLVGRT